MPMTITSLASQQAGILPQGPLSAARRLDAATGWAGSPRASDVVLAAASSARQRSIVAALMMHVSDSVPPFLRGARMIIVVSLCAVHACFDHDSR